MSSVLVEMSDSVNVLCDSSIVDETVLRSTYSVVFSELIGLSELTKFTSEVVGFVVTLSASVVVNAIDSVVLLDSFEVDLKIFVSTVVDTNSAGLVFEPTDSVEELSFVLLVGSVDSVIVFVSSDAEIEIVDSKTDELVTLTVRVLVCVGMVGTLFFSLLAEPVEVVILLDCDMAELGLSIIVDKKV